LTSRYFQSTLAIQGMSKRVLIFTTDLERGGTPTVVRDLATRLRNPRIDIDVGCLGRFGPVAQELQDRGVNVWAMNARSTLALPGVVLKLVKHVRQHHYDRVLSFLMHANVVCAMASTKSPASTVWFQSVQTTQPYPWWHWQLQRIAQGAGKKVIVPSQSVAQAAISRSDISPGKIVVIPNAVDRFPKTIKVDGCVRVGFVGRFDPVKRIGDLIEAMQQLPQAYQLHLFGDGPMRGELESKARALGTRAVFHGMVKDMSQVYSRLDVLVLPSDAEGMPMVLIEAMSAGVAVVGARSPGIVDVIEHEVTGLLYPPRDVEALAKMIVRASQDPTSLRERATSIVNTRYSWDVVLEQYRAVLEL
jgi:glycosyltransferase involved in cell wall biosynthesis